MEFHSKEELNEAMQILRKHGISQIKSEEYGYDNSVNVKNRMWYDPNNVQRLDLLKFNFILHIILEKDDPHKMKKVIDELKNRNYYTEYVHETFSPGRNLIIK